MEEVYVLFLEKMCQGQGDIKELLILSDVLYSTVIMVFLSIRNAFWNTLGKKP